MYRRRSKRISIASTIHSTYRRSAKYTGVLEVKRYVLDKPADSVPKYAALYRVASADVPQGPAWVKASDTGDWKPKIRPHTFNRKHALYKAI